MVNSSQQLTFDEFIEGQILRTNRNLLVANIFILICGIAFLSGIIYAIYESIEINTFGGGMGIFFGVIIILVMIMPTVAISNIVKAIKRFQNSERHPLLESLSRFSGSAQNHINSIEKEMQNAIYSRKNIIITKTWMILPTFFGINIFHNSEVVWVYPKKLTYFALIIPTFIEYSVIIRIGQLFKSNQKLGDSNKSTSPKIIRSQFEVKCKKQDTEQIMPSIQQMNSPVLLGNSLEYEKLWKKNPLGLYFAVKEPKTEN